MLSVFQEKLLRNPLNLVAGLYEVLGEPLVLGVGCVIQVVGPSGSGKTTTIVKVVRSLRELGFKVAVLKHTHHEIDVPGKDSWRFLEEGGAEASIVVRGDGERVAIFTRLSLEDILEVLRLSFDVVLVEGFSRGLPREPDATLTTTDPGFSDAKLIETIMRVCGARRG